MKNEPETLTCWTCNTDFPWLPTTSYQQRPRLCQTCEAAALEANFTKAKSSVRAEVLKNTPARFQSTDCSHPEFRSSLWERVKHWLPTSERPWLGLIGLQGTCKTRVAYMALHEVALGMIRKGTHPDIMPKCPSLAAVSSYQLGHAVSELAGDGKKTAADFLQRMARVRILLIDDLGKQRNTAAMSNHLFAILDSRYADNLCTIWTANLSPQEIVAGMPDDIGTPLVGRILECSTILSTE